MTDSPLISLEQQEHAARNLMVTRADTLAQLATLICDDPAATTDGDIERLSGALVSLAERYGQWRTVRTALGAQRRAQRRGEPPSRLTHHD